MPKETVRDGYNTLAAAYQQHYPDSHARDYHNWLDAFLPFIPRGHRVLELGCGNGIPVAQRLLRDYSYWGVDISPVQIELARRTLPEGHFQVADMTELSFPDAYFSGVIALYSIIHVPLPEQPMLIESFHRWLQPGGYGLIIVGTEAWTGTEENWITPGTTMYWSHADTGTYLQWFISAGFTVVSTQFIPEGKGGHTLLVVKKE